MGIEAALRENQRTSQTVAAGR